MEFFIFSIFHLILASIALPPMLWLIFSLVKTKQHRIIAFLGCFLWFFLLFLPLPLEDRMASFPYVVIVMFAFMTALYVCLALLQLFRFFLLIIGKLLSLAHIHDFELFIRSKICSIILLVLGLGLTGYGIYESVKIPDVKKVTVPIADLDPSLEGYRILQLTDLHVGLILNDTWLEKIVAKSNEQNPDIIVVTGDSAEFSPDVLKEGSLAALKDLKAPNGVYFVLGNHEHYGNLSAWLDFFQDNELTLLYDSYVALPDVPIVIGGTRSATHFDDFQVDYEALFKDAPEGLRILLSHFPIEIKNAAQNDIDLQISGHTHGGTFFFLKPIVAAANGGLLSGLYEVEDSSLYVSNGTGLWTPIPLRLGVPSEITILQLTRK